MINTISTVDMPHEEWLKHRKNAIGGSDASTICGLNPYSSLYELWADKLSKIPPKEENEAMRFGRMTKSELIHNFRKVLMTIVMFYDIKAAHDCLTSIVEELDEKGALLEQKNERINLLYKDLTGRSSEAFDAEIENLPPRMWVE